jgi:flagellar basal body-associated protein FliL
VCPHTPQSSKSKKARKKIYLLLLSHVVVVVVVVVGNVVVILVASLGRAPSSSATPSFCVAAMWQKSLFSFLEKNGFKEGKGKGP